MIRNQFEQWIAALGFGGDYDRQGSDDKNHERIWISYRPARGTRSRNLQVDCENREFRPEERHAIAECIAKITGCEPPKE